MILPAFVGGAGPIELLVLLLVFGVLAGGAVLVVAAGVFGVRLLGDDGEGTAESGDEDPVETLKRRYAEGEIGEEEFDRRMERLVGGDDTDPEREGADP